MSARIASWVWVDAHRRRCEAEGAMAMVMRKGEREAGAVMLKVNWLGAGATALTRATLGDGRLGWIWLAGPEPQDEAQVDAKLERQAEFDPDVWILEVEDREGRHFLDDPIA